MPTAYNVGVLFNPFYATYKYDKYYQGLA